MLHLAASSSPDWGTRAISALDEILLDHAHCEKKAASTAINLIFRYSGRPSLMVPLSRLAREELSHFELVLGHVRRRGFEYRRLSPSPYAPALLSIVRPQEPLKLVDTLLCCALIEARSCERMQALTVALAEADEDPALIALYDGLLACEARHFQTYVDLIGELDIVSDADLRERLDDVAAHEATVLAEAPAEARLHSAGPALPPVD